jgi:hypothetical protein
LHIRGRNLARHRCTVSLRGDHGLGLSES